MLYNAKISNKSNIENMGLPGIAFAPIVNLVDAGCLSSEAGELQNFMKNQIGDAEILGINKVDLVDSEKLLEICLLLRRLNSRARIIHFSARQGGEDLGKLLGLMEETSRGEIIQDEKNSIKMSGVSAYSSEFEIASQEISIETAVCVSEQILESIRNKAEELNSEFTGHIKLSFRHQGNLVKGSVTSAHKIPEMEVLKKEGKSQSRVKVLSAVTSVPRDELIKAVDEAISRRLEERQLSFKKVERSRPGYSQATIVS